MKKKIIGCLLLVVIVVGLIYGLGSIILTKLGGISPVSLTIEEERKTELTPIEITEIRKIGQWEFLSLSTEELVDSIKKGILFDDRLACIYQGRLSLGINMEQFNENWFHITGTDSIALTLPPITLLDQEFIKETKTKVFEESGEWSGKERKELYQKAQKRMIQRALSPENRKLAEEHARTLIKQQMQSFGFRHVEISFQNN